MNLDQESDRDTLLQLMGRVAIGSVPTEHRSEFIRLLTAIETATVADSLPKAGKAKPSQK